MTNHHSVPGAAQDVRPRAKSCYFVGGGIGSLAGAAFAIRDGGVRAEDITVFEAAAVVGGSLDGGGSAEAGYTLRGGRMFTSDNYECTWELFKTIPSLDGPDKTVFDEFVEFNEKHVSHSLARLVDRNRSRIDVRSMGFSIDDRLELLKLSNADEETLGSSRITDWLSPSFFETKFWLMWATTFAFQPWHSALELKRYLHRFMLEFSRIDTLAGVKRTPYNQYDSLVRPLLGWLVEQGVKIETGCRVTDIETVTLDGRVQVTALQTTHHGTSRRLEIADDDVVFFQNASMTDASTFGSMTAAPARMSKVESGGWALWEKLASAHRGFGRPAAFDSSIPESFWESFTVTLRDSTFFDAMERFTENRAGTGNLVTFKDSRWLLSVVLARQPHFLGQPEGVQVFWGYALHPDRVGDFVGKPMADCSGAEILKELCGHLDFDLAMMDTATCIPCRMPYITSMFMPRAPGDRPKPVPDTSRNLAFISQFVEIPDDCVFAVEYSIRVAQMAVYRLLGIDLEVPAIHAHDRSLATKLEVLIKALR